MLVVVNFVLITVILRLQWSKYDFCTSQGSVATTLGRGGQNCRHLRQVSF